jgi:uncharacterized protein YaaN involved in tellurite resistance
MRKAFDILMDSLDEISAIEKAQKEAWNEAINEVLKLERTECRTGQQVLFPYDIKKLLIQFCQSYN